MDNPFIVSIYSTKDYFLLEKTILRFLLGNLFWVLPPPLLVVFAEMAAAAIANLVASSSLAGVVAVFVSSGASPGDLIYTI